MAADETRSGSVQARGVEADGLEAYPTYHDGAAPGHATAGAKPTDTGLPRSRRTYALPILIGLIVFGLVIAVRMIWGGVNVAQTSDDALTPGDPASQPVSTAAEPGNLAETPAAPGGGQANEQPDTQASPGEVEAPPGPIDVPGGATTTPIAPAPAQ